MRAGLLAVALALVSGCATYVDVQREQKTIFTVQADRPGVGLLDVSVPDDILARAPNDFGNMTGLIAKVTRDYCDEHGGFNAVDYTQLGFHPRWERSNDARLNAPPMRVPSMEGVPAGVQTPLVTVARVIDWRTYNETFNNKTVDVAHVQLVLSTWTREGREVHTEQVDALARAGDQFLHLKAGDDHLVVWYQKSDGRGPFYRQPEKRTELFMNALREAIGVHYYPYFPHKVQERLVLADDEPLKAGNQAAMRGAWDEAKAAWKEVADKNPKADGALYNMAMAELVQGNDAQAHALLKQAYEINDKMLYGGMLENIGARMGMRKSITPAGEISTAPAS